MAARGHVQDPNDRRLRPIYGEDSMGSFLSVGVWRFGECFRSLCRCVCLNERVLDTESCDAAPPTPTTDSAARSAQ